MSKAVPCRPGVLVTHTSHEEIPVCLVRSRNFKPHGLLVPRRCKCNEYKYKYGLDVLLLTVLNQTPTIKTFIELETFYCILQYLNSIHRFIRHVSQQKPTENGGTDRHCDLWLFRCNPDVEPPFQGRDPRPPPALKRTSLLHRSHADQRFNTIPSVIEEDMGDTGIWGYGGHGWKGGEGRWGLHGHCNGYFCAGSFMYRSS